MDEIVRSIYKFLKKPWSLNRLFVRDGQVFIKAPNSKNNKTLQDYFGRDPTVLSKDLFDSVKNITMALNDWNTMWWVDQIHSIYQLVIDIKKEAHRGMKCFVDNKLGEKHPYIDKLLIESHYKYLQTVLLKVGKIGDDMWSPTNEGKLRALVEELLKEPHP